MTGCVKTVVETVRVDNFCEGRYESLWLEDKDFTNLGAMRSNENHKVTIDKFIDNTTVNEKEYQLCLEKENAEILK